MLANKYRPKDFSGLYGQEIAVRTLRNGFETGRICPAYMLTGTRGVGKTTIARIIARALNYELVGKTSRPTTHMPKLGVHCKSIIDGCHVDVVEIDAASHAGIQDIRELVEAARYKPMSARTKVYIIDEVHMLSNAAFNGLLKTLEEPHEHVKFVLATTELRKVPVTVLSRCQTISLRRIGVSDLIGLLSSVCSEESVLTTDTALRQIAHAAEGSARDALSLLEQAIICTDGRLEEVEVLSMLGRAGTLVIVSLFESVMRGDASSAMEQFKGQFELGVDPVILLSDLADFVHFVTKVKVMGVRAVEESVSEVESTSATKFAAGLSILALSRAWQILLKGIEEVRTASGSLAAFDMVLIRLCHLVDLPTPTEVIKSMASICRNVSAGTSCGSADMMSTEIGKQKDEGSLAVSSCSGGAYADVREDPMFLETLRCFSGSELVSVQPSLSDSQNTLDEE